MPEIIVDESLFLISMVFNIISGIMIILLLAVQSFVLIKLMPLIKTTAENSSFISDLTKPFTEKKQVSVYPQELIQLNIKNCKHFEDQNHRHDQSCL